MFILSIDIGIRHLGLVWSVVSEKYETSTVKDFSLLDITCFLHNKVPRDECTLFHERTFTDWIEHIFQEFPDWFSHSDKILIERQPPIGLVAIEQLIFSRYRKKAILISPNQMHSFFHISDYDYEKRKEKMVEKLTKYIPEDKRQEFQSMKRKHDIADAIGMLKFWVDKNRKQVEKQERLDRVRNQSCLFVGKDIDAFLDTFRYSKK